MPRHKKPIEQHLAEGTFRTSRQGSLVGGFPVLDKAPPCPAGITDRRARAAWDTILPQLAGSSRLAPEDLPGLEMAFRTLARVHGLEDALEKLEPAQDASKYRMLSSVMSNQAAFFIDVLSRFGFSSKGREALAQTLARAKTTAKKGPLEAMTE